MKKQQIHRDFEVRFGDKLFQKSLNYIPTEQDLYDATEIFNKHIFNNRLKIDDIEIICKMYQQKDKGTTCFGRYKKLTAKYLITIYKHETGDSFYQLMNILAHELIHVYDYICGEIYKLMVKHSKEILSGYYVTNYNNHQYVGEENYNAHGKFFMSFANKFKQVGFDITEHTNINAQKKMKNLKEKTSNEQFDFFYETEDSQEMMTYKAIKTMFDHIIAPGKRLIYRNAKEWFIEFS